MYVLHRVIVLIPSTFICLLLHSAKHSYSYQTAVDQISTLFKGDKIIQPALGTTRIQQTEDRPIKKTYQKVASYLTPNGTQMHIFVFSSDGKPSYTVNDFYINNLGFAHLTTKRPTSEEPLATFLKDGTTYYLQYTHRFSQ